jgi:gamma-glutamyltranspeptidase/glutathione hydrolase
MIEGKLMSLLIILFAAAAVVSDISSLSAAPVQEPLERFHPVWSSRGMVVAQEKLASKAGAAILADGGTAVDAAVAVGFALAVTLPKAGNLGGGGFMVLWLSKGKKAIAINYREKAPSVASRDMYLDERGNVDKFKATKSYLSTGVPGTVAGLVLAQENYGTLPLKRVLMPAIDLASNGFVVTKELSASIAGARDLLFRDPASRARFFRKDGTPLQPGDLLVQTELAATLKLIAEKGAPGFYQGPVADMIVSAMQGNGGIITHRDLKDYRAKVMTPVRGTYRGYQVISMPPPSSGGVTLIEMLNILEPVPLKNTGLNSAATIHMMVESMNLAYNDRNYYLGDPDFVTMPVDRLTSKKYAAKLRAKINPAKHTPAGNISWIKPIAGESHDTTHYSVIDKNGNMASNTYTINYSYGNGVTVPGAGFLLNNEMDDFTAKPGVPNSYGLVQGDANGIEPGKRPLSSMTPTLVLTPGGVPFLATGSLGGSRIITTILQVILNRISHELNAATSVAAPRVHSQLWPDVVSYEEGISMDTLNILRQMGHRLRPVNAMGSAQTVEFTGPGLGTLGVADPRRQGAAAIGPTPIDRTSGPQAMNRAGGR